MNPLELPTENLRLILQTTEEVLAQIEALSPADQAEVSPAWLARVRASASPDPWTHDFRIESRAGGEAIGHCGYKGPPDADGMVEIAYGVNPDRQGRGYATEAARALVDFALASGLVRVVRAHTRANVASERVLEKLGFQRIGEVVEPEDGVVCRWERGRG